MDTQLGLPVYVGYGAKDSSIRKVPVTLSDLGQLVNKSYVFAAKGSDECKIIKADGAIAAYGDETFNPLSQYYNHGTRFLQKFLKYGGASSVKRIIPSDTKNESNINIYIDIIKVSAPNYLRDSLGGYVYDKGVRTPKINEANPTIQKHRIKFISEFETGKATCTAIGKLATKPGTMVDENGVASMMHPLMQVPAKLKGKDYDLLGFGFDSIDEADLDMDVVKNIGSMLYDFKMYLKPSHQSKPKVMSTLLGEKSIRVSLKDKAINYKTRGDISFDGMFNTSYYNETDNSIAMRDEELEDFYIYRANLENIQKQILATEKEHVTGEVVMWNDKLPAKSESWFDYSDEMDMDAQGYMINLFTCRSSKNVPYFTVALDEAVPSLDKNFNQKEIRISNNTPIMLRGGDNGTMSLEEYNRGVADDLDSYLDPLSEYQNPVLCPESIMFDPGYPLDIKIKMFKFITMRKDTCIVLSPYDYSSSSAGHRMSTSDELAVLRALNGAAMLAPESTYHNTECGRAAVVMGGGILPGNGKEVIPNVYEIMGRMAQMMSGKNWKKDFIFDDSCYSRDLVDITPKSIPDASKAVFTKLGAIYPEPANGGVWKFIALQTLYSIQESVMNNIFTMVAIATADRLARYNWLLKSGNMRDVNSKFLADVEESLSKDLLDRFANMFVTAATAEMTNKDKAAGSRYHVKTSIKGNIAKVTAFHTTEIDRIEE